jgi:hypothetical protein
MVAESPERRNDRQTIETIKQRDDGKATKVINLVKSIESSGREHDDPFGGLRASKGGAGEF